MTQSSFSPTSNLHQESLESSNKFNTCTMSSTHHQQKPLDPEGINKRFPNISHMAYRSEATCYYSRPYRSRFEKVRQLKRLEIKRRPATGNFAKGIAEMLSANRIRNTPVPESKIVPQQSAVSTARLVNRMRGLENPGTDRFNGAGVRIHNTQKGTTVAAPQHTPGHSCQWRSVNDARAQLTSVAGRFCWKRCWEGPFLASAWLQELVQG